MLAHTLVLDCPRAVSENESIRSDCPNKLPEARRALQAGKLPRQAGMILVRHDQQYDLTLQAETLAVTFTKEAATNVRQPMRRSVWRDSAQGMASERGCQPRRCDSGPLR